MRPAGENGTAGVGEVIERADTVVPSYLASRAPVPHTPLLLRQGLSLWGLTETAVTGQALGTKAGRVALGTGLSAAALRAPGRCSTAGCRAVMSGHLNPPPASRPLLYFPLPLPTASTCLLLFPHPHFPRLLLKGVTQFS